MKLQIKELGAIKDGTIDLSKKLNVFCGPNGTGKTYMAYAIYGLLKNRIHIGSNEELVKKLIDKKNISYHIDFDALNEYRKDLILNFKEDFDSLFGINFSNLNPWGILLTLLALVIIVLIYQIPEIIYFSLMANRHVKYIDRFLSKIEMKP